MQPQLVFVYGTLKRPYGNSRILEESSDLIGEAVTEDKFLLVNCGFPYMIPPDMLDKEHAGLEDHVLGQVWEVNDNETLQRLDWLEGVGHGHYRHQDVKVMIAGGETLTARAFVPCDRDAQDYPPCRKTLFGEKEVYEWTR